MCRIPVAILRSREGFISFPAYGCPPTQRVIDTFGRMDEARARDVDNHTRASESLRDAPDPAATATTMWGMYNTTPTATTGGTYHQQQPATVNDCPTGASSAIAEAANGDRQAIEPQGEVTPPTPFGEPLPPAPEGLRRKSKKTLYGTPH